MTVSDSFIKLIERIQPRPREIELAQSHRDTIKSRLEKNFEVKKFELIGSHARGSAIRSYSDVDYLVLLSRSDVKWGGQYISSGTLLRKVGNILKFRYPQTTIRKDKQAKTINFGSGFFAVDIVPAFFEEIDADYRYPIYSIPDTGGNWLYTSPDLHNRYIVEANERGGSKLVRVAQLIKWWLNSRVPPVPLHMFHVEMLLAYKEICKVGKSYSECMADFFDLLYQRGCRPFRDPFKIASLIAPTNTELQGDNLFKSISLSRDRAYKALDFEYADKHLLAARFWNYLFNGKFPT
jgi:hypothetical protein